MNKIYKKILKVAMFYKFPKILLKLLLEGYWLKWERDIICINLPIRNNRKLRLLYSKAS
jgi:hypothetical protein